MFTYSYQQPPEYHFSLDSIEFAAFVANQLNAHHDLSSSRMLDLCAGCGIIGLQISYFLTELKNIDFLEIQEIYTPYFEQNIAIVNRPELNCQWHLCNYDVLLETSWEKKYDIIVSNPPYFRPGHGMLSPSKFKNHCRFFLDSSFNNFILALANTLADNGKAYFLLRPLFQHGYNLIADIHTILQNHSVSINKITTIRGTDVICLTKFHPISEKKNDSI